MLSETGHEATGSLAATADPDLLAADLHSSLADPALEAMNFLNEAASRFPGAISFAAGRPTEELFSLDAIPRYLERFCAYLRSEKGLGEASVARLLLQYGRTKGIMHELLARHLALDEDIRIDPEAIVVTVGCQEAMFLALRALCTSSDDLVLAVSPCYVGLTGAARLLDLQVSFVRETEHGLDLGSLVTQIEAARSAGKRPRVCYVTPDFANPSGLSLDVATRKALLAIAEEHDLFLLEDNPYGLFQASEESRIPTLKALDARRRVIYLGSLAKTCFPGVRIGYAVADQVVRDAQGRSTLLADSLSKIKSMLTVNTSPVAQAIAGGMLLENGCSLETANRAQIAIYRRNLGLLLQGLARRFPSDGPLRVTWNRPRGGFFVVVTVPFLANEEMLLRSAACYGVLWTPMNTFYGGSGGAQQLRLSLSALSPDQIDAGLDRFAALVADAVGQAA